MYSFGDRRGRKMQAAEGKISLRLIEFAEPMVAEAFEGDGDPTPADLESVLKLAVTIWNAKVVEQIGRGSGYVDEIERLILRNSQLPPKARYMTKLMQERKITKFPDDVRLISDFKAYTTPDGEMSVKAEARLASDLRHEN